MVTPGAGYQLLINDDEELLVSSAGAEGGADEDEEEDDGGGGSGRAAGMINVDSRLPLWSAPAEEYRQVRTILTSTAAALLPRVMPTALLRLTG